MPPDYCAGLEMLWVKSRTEIRQPIAVCHTGLLKLWTPLGGHRLAAAGNAQADAPGVIAGRCRHKKAPDDAGAFELLKSSRDQYFATNGPPQLKR